MEWKQKYATLSWSSTTLKENGITEVTDLEFTLKLMTKMIGRGMIWFTKR